MLTTDTGAEIGPYSTSFFYCHLHELAYSLLVEHLEWVYLQDLLLEINRQERCYVVTPLVPNEKY